MNKSKIGKVMGEFKAGSLHSGSKKGPKVTNPKQAVAIAMSEAGMSKKKAPVSSLKELRSRAKEKLKSGY